MCMISPVKVIRVALMESYGEIRRVPVNLSKVSIENAKSRIFRTAAGCRLLESIFLREE